MLVVTIGAGGAGWIAPSSNDTILGTESSPSLAPVGGLVREPDASRAPVMAAKGLPRDPEPPTGRWTEHTLGPTPPSQLTGYRWPLKNARITNAFGVGRPGTEVAEGEMMHDGIDISSFCGAHVLAAHDGVVLTAGRRYEAFVGWVGDLEPYRARLDRRGGWGGLAIAVVIDDGNGYRSIYLHLNLATVKKGDSVRAGQMIGYQGSTGNATGCHLHYALFSPLERRTIAFDPDLAARWRLPARKIARIDPLLVLPPPADASITWGWGSGKPS